VGFLHCSNVPLKETDGQSTSAFRATVENHRTASSLPPVQFTVARSPNQPLITLRVRDSGGGIPSKDLKDVFSYAYTSVNSGADEAEEGPYGVQNAGAPPLFGEITKSGMQTGLGTIAGLGYG
jgi:26S proteasome regulatory subunit T1